MKNIIFCEGKTDAILLSYYLEKVVGWKFDKKLSRKISLPIRNFKNEQVSVYSKEKEELVIWAVGGKDNFKYALGEIIKANKTLEEEYSYKKIIVLTDRDRADDDRIILNELETILFKGDILIDIENNNEWICFEYKNYYDEISKGLLLPIIIPFSKQGALETFILEAIKEIGEEEKYIAEKSQEYIFSFNLKKYLNTDRIKLKGELAIVLATLFPQKTFTPIDNMLKELDWEKYKTIQQGFEKLEEI